MIIGHIEEMVKVVLFGGLGAIVNSAIALHWSSLTLEHIFSELVLQPFSVLRSLLPAVLGFLFGSAIILIWSFLRQRVIRFLLQYNGWFLTPRSYINRVWYLLMILLLGKKQLGANKYQEFLPSLPVPSLKKTCKRYLESVRPLLSDEQYQKTEDVVKEFQRKEGKRLQFYLKLRSWTHRNWIKEWWEEYIYFRQRTPIAFNSNYYCIGNKRPSSPHQLDRAATLMYLAVKFTKEFEKGNIPNMMALDLVPFCMHGTKYYANTTRVPGREVDRYKYKHHSKVYHNVILRQGKFYKIQVVAQDGCVLPRHLIKKQLEQIVQMAGDELDKTGVMAFTARPRTEWAEIRERLEKDPVNRETLEAIDYCYQLVVLETESVPADDYTARSRTMFHGNVYNRWFDKCFTSAVYANGVVGSNIEHSLLDATVCTQVWEFMLQKEEYDENGHIPESDNNTEVELDFEPMQLHWNLEGLEEELTKSKQLLRDMIDDSDLIITIPGYGKAVPKKCRLSPDGWFQMALQLAYYRLHHRFVLTYESATTRLYCHGRTETIRPVSIHSKAFVESMEDPNVTVEERKKLLKKAIEYQEKYKFEAMRGMGIDRHLFGLYIIAKWLKLDPMPKLFLDEAFQLKFVLSTSQTPVQIIKKNWRLERSTIGGGFGTVTDTGYGVSYIVVGDDTVFYSIHCKKSCTTTSSTDLGNAIVTAFDDMKELYAAELATPISN